MCEVSEPSARHLSLYKLSDEIEAECDEHEVHNDLDRLELHCEESDMSEARKRV
jgi:hypothetical protein